MIGCCEVAIAGLICQIISLGIYAGYNIKLKEKQLELERENRKIKKEIQEVERVNGKEKQDIKDLQEKIKDLEKKLIHE